MTRDPNIEPADRISAHHLIAKIAAAVRRIYDSGPARLSQRHAFPRTSLTAPGTTGFKFVIKKKNEEEEPDKEYDKLE